MARKENNGKTLFEGTSEVDVFDGGNGKDSLSGLADDDILSGGNGKDMLYGGEDNDQLFGGNGSDTLNGGEGDDTLEGGRGPDIFVFSESSGEDVITDFELTTLDEGEEEPDEDELTSDVIDLSAFEFEDIEDLEFEQGDEDNTIIHLTEDDTITLIGVDHEQLTNDHFIFA